MKNEKKSSGKISILAASIIAGAMAGLSVDSKGADLFNYSSLGSGAALRSALIHSSTTPSKLSELECGNKTGEKTNAEKSKTGESKCGEGKCGDKNKKKPAGATTTQKGKTSEGKCGEGKCGGKK